MNVLALIVLCTALLSAYVCLAVPAGDEKTKKETGVTQADKAKIESPVVKK